MQLITPAAAKRLGILAVLAVIGAVWCWFTMIRMPGASHAGPLPEITGAQLDLADEMRTHVEMLAGTIGPRNIAFSEALAASADYIEDTLATSGHAVERQTFSVDGVECSNLIASIAGSTAPEEIVVVGAHYDSFDACAGANDNASGVAGCLVLARRLRDAGLDRTVRFLLFTNEEPPYFWTEDMGSLRYAKRCESREEDIVAMLSLETIGHYDDADGSQAYPPPTGPRVPVARQLRRVRRQLRIARARASLRRLLPRHDTVPVRGRRPARLDHGSRVVRPLGLLEGRVRRCHGH